MGIVAILFFLGALGLSFVWSLICAGLTAWFISRKKRGNFLFLTSLNLGLVLFPFHQAVLTWHEPNSSDNGIGALLDMSIWLPVVSVFLIHWVIVLWLDAHQSWRSKLLATVLVLGLVFAYFKWPLLIWIILLMVLMLGLQLSSFVKPRKL